MRNRLIQILCLTAVTLTFLTACNEEAEDINDVNKQTLLVFMPWSGNLYSAFQVNLDSIESGIKAKGGTGDSRVMVFISESTQRSTLSEIVYDEQTKECTRQQVKEYTGNDYTTAEGIAGILSDVRRHADALNYAMIIGCHGTGWTYKSDWEDYPTRAKRSGGTALGETPDERFPIETTTRFYGSVRNADEIQNYATDVPTLAEGIALAGMKMQYILFDDCYMANVEVAYELRNVTNFLIASTSEVLYFGMPYHSMWSSLCTSTPNYASAVSAFYNFYSNYQYPYGALSAIDCREMDKVADIMRQINQHAKDDETLADSTQVLDGYSPHIFYDLQDYVSRLCDDPLLTSKMENELGTLIRSTARTDTIYTAITWPGRYFVPKTYSGITISDPSQHPAARKGVRKTAWYQATHIE